MKITKFGHSCLLVEEKNARILIDPGSYSTLQNSVENIDVILITHEHFDHLDPSSIKTILAKNPSARIFTSAAVGRKLAEANIFFDTLGNGQSITVNDVLVEGFGEIHAEIHPAYPRMPNTGYRIGGRFFYGGDSLENIVPCEVLAYPAVAPWMRAAEAVEYAKKIKPKVCFPVHDAFLKPPHPFYALPEKLLGEAGIKWVIIREGESVEL